MQSNQKKRAYIFLYVPEELAKFLKDEAKKQHRSLNNYVSLVLDDHKKKETVSCISAR